MSARSALSHEGSPRRKRRRACKYSERPTLMVPRRAERAAGSNAAQVIQRWWRGASTYSLVDPVTLDRPERPLFTHVDRDSGVATRFGAAALHAYFRASGKFEHPSTRAPFTKHDVVRLERVLGITQSSESSLASKMQDMRAVAKEEARRACLVDYMRQRVGQVFEEMLDACEVCYPLEVGAGILTEKTPEFVEEAAELHSVSRDACFALRDHLDRRLLTCAGNPVYVPRHVEFVKRLVDFAANCVWKLPPEGAAGGAFAPIAIV